MAQTKPKAGQFYGVSGNGTDGQFLQTDGTGGMAWADPIVAPTLTSIDYPGTTTAADPAGGESIIINGTGFQTGITCTIGGTSATTAFNSATQITITSPAKAAGQYTVAVTNTDGGGGSSANFIQYSGVPVWSTNSGSLGSVQEGASASFQVTATEGSDTIEYAVTTGSLPSGLSLATATGAITGTAPSVSADTTSTFSITATDDENQTSSERSFSITVTNDVPSNYFNTVLYTGNATAGNTTSQSITSVGFQPDVVWIKNRDNSNNHVLFDSIRGATNWINPNNTNQQYSNSYTAGASFLSNGFTTGTSDQTNKQSDNIVAWCFKAGGTPTATNSAGQTPTLGSKMIDGVADSSAFATVSNGYPTKQSINTNLDFSITEYTKTTSANSEIPHGLSGTPDLVIIKFIAPGYLDQWQVWQSSMSTGSYLMLQDSDVVTSRANSFSTVNSTYVANSWTSGSQAQVMYSFKSKSGFSKSGSYTGNGSSNGPMIETGFEPAYIMVKEATGTTNNWYIYDNKRSTSNPRNKLLAANNGDVESTNTSMNMNWYANGFQPIDTGGGMNRSGSTYVYLAMAADPSTTTPTLADSFGVDLYTGNGGTQIINSVGFKPDLVWVKSRKNTAWYSVIDSIRGGSKRIVSNSSNAETTDVNRITSFDAGGFTVGSDGDLNGNNYSLVGWCWKAGGTPGAINTDGTIDSIVSVNQAAGFSIVKYTGNATSGATIAHSLGGDADMVIVKSTNLGQAWNVYIKDVTDTDSKYLRLNTTDSIGSLSTSNYRFIVNNFSSTVFSVGSDNSTNGNGDNYIAYCFKSIANFSKIGSFSGNRPSTVTVTTGFEPAWVMIKDTTNNGEGWAIIDNKRVDELLEAQSSNAETSYNSVQFTSTGFTVGDSGLVNTSGATIIYIAIKEN